MAVDDHGAYRKSSFAAYETWSLPVLVVLCTGKLYGKYSESCQQEKA